MRCDECMACECRPWVIGKLRIEYEASPTLAEGTISRIALYHHYDFNQK